MDHRFHQVFLTRISTFLPSLPIYRTAPVVNIGTRALLLTETDTQTRLEIKSAIKKAQITSKNPNNPKETPLISFQGLSSANEHHLHVLNVSFCLSRLVGLSVRIRIFCPTLRYYKATTRTKEGTLSASDPFVGPLCNNFKC